jgi:hypothetical protein
MADTSAPHADVPQGRIPREDADQVVIGCLIQIACGTFDPTTERALALQLLSRALPLASAATRIAALRPHANAVLNAAHARLTREGAGAWCRAVMGLRDALASDAIQRAAAKVEV